MKQNIFSLLLVLCTLFATNSLQAQRVLIDGNSQGPGIQMGIDIRPGDHKSEEVIIRFDAAPSDQSRAQIEKDLRLFQNFHTEEWSPSGKFLRASAPGLVVCDYDGHGNPQSDSGTQGDQISLNYYANTIGWRNVNRFFFECVPAPGLTEPIFGQNGEPTDPPTSSYDYNPALECSDDANLIPNTGNQKVKIAIIDSGLKSLPSQGIKNGVAYEQTVIPADCSRLACEPVRNGIETQSRGFHPHGGYIFELISNWFNSEGLASQLSVSSYQVLDEDLQTTVFQVIKAIELATMEKEKPQVISLSLGFRPLQCGDSTDPILGPGLGVDPDLGVDDGPKGLHSPLYYAIKAAEEQNIIVVTSAGNDGNSLDAYPQYPAAEEGLENLVTVGGLECGSNIRSPWSNYSNNHVDLFAPGAEVKSVSNSCYVSISGTSFSCPIVAAKAAFHVTAQEEYDVDEVLCLLRSEATPFGGSKYGIVNVAANSGSCDGEGKKNVEENLSAITPTIISPNPFADHLTIRQSFAPEESAAVLTIFDGQGREIIRRETKTETTTLDVQDLVPGVYWLNITSASGSETRPVVKH